MGTRAWEKLDSVHTDEGVLELRRGESDFLILVDGRVLMQSVVHRSEVELAVVACRPLHAAPQPRVLDLYEGPYVATGRPDDPVFGKAALARAKAALAPAGVLSIWSEDREDAFERRLREQGFAVEVRLSGRGGRRHAIYVATHAAPRRR